MHWSPGRPVFGWAGYYVATFPLPDRATAKIAERAAHAKARGVIISFFFQDGGEGWRSEWFNAPVGHLSAAPLPGPHRASPTEPRSGSTCRRWHVAMLDKWRSEAQPDTPIHVRGCRRTYDDGLSWPRWKGMPCSPDRHRARPEPSSGVIHSGLGSARGSGSLKSYVWGGAAFTVGVWCGACDVLASRSL